jgi:hypothetical protein
MGLEGASVMKSKTTNGSNDDETHVDPRLDAVAIIILVSDVGISNIFHI